MKISRDKVEVIKARKQMTAKDLASNYGISRQRMCVILNQKEVSPVVAGKIAKALGVDVTEILED